MNLLNDGFFSFNSKNSYLDHIIWLDWYTDLGFNFFICTRIYSNIPN